MSEVKQVAFAKAVCQECGVESIVNFTLFLYGKLACPSCGKPMNTMLDRKPRKHKSHDMRDTSLLSYIETQETSLGEMQRLVYDAIRNYLTPPTDREIAKALSLTDPNAVRPRRNELMEQGFIVEAGKRKCTVTGRLALTWRVKK